MPSLPPLVTSLTERLKTIPGVIGIVLGGSHATGTATPQSDIDLGLIYDGHDPFDLPALARLCAELDDSGSSRPSPIGGWGPWVDGGAWLTVHEQRVDFIYRDLRRIEQSVQDALDGRLELFSQPGHPHGIHAHHYAGELARAILLHDPGGRLAALQAQVTTYPPALTRAMQPHYGWQKGFWLDMAEKGEKRGDAHYVHGCLYQAVMSAVQEICAVHGVWLLNEKGAFAQAAAQPGVPAEWGEKVTAALQAQSIPTLRQLLAFNPVE